MKWLRGQWNQWRKRRALRSIHESMAALGYSFITDLTDEEIEAGVIMVAGAARLGAVSMEELGDMIQWIREAASADLERTDGGGTARVM